MKTVTFPVKGLNVAGCAREIEKHLGKQDGISQAEASYVTQTVTITFDDARLSEAALHEQVRDCGFACGVSRGALQGAPGATQGGRNTRSFRWDSWAGCAARCASPRTRNLLRPCLRVSSAARIRYPDRRDNDQVGAT